MTENLCYMKKLFLILAVLAFSTTLSAQSKLMTVRGKDKDGKTIKVEYYQGAATDAIESVKYQLVDELQTKITNLQSKLDATTAQLKKCQKQADNIPDDDDIQVTMLQNLILMKDAQIDSLTLQVQQDQVQLQRVTDSLGNGDVAQLKKSLKEKESQIKSLNKEVKRLEGKLQKSGDNDAEIKQLQDQIASKQTEIDNLNKQISAEQKKSKGYETDLANLRSQISSKENEITSLKNEKADLQRQLTAADAGGDAEKKQLRQQITDLQNNADRLNTQINGLKSQLNSLNSDLARKNDSISTLKAQLAQGGGSKPVVVSVSDTTINKRTYQRLRDSIVSQDATIRGLDKSLAECEKRVNDLQKQINNMPTDGVTMAKPAKTHSIGVEGGVGAAFMLDKMEGGWDKGVKPAWHVDMYYGTPRLADKFPISFEVGLGIRGLSFALHHNPSVATMDATDADGDSYQAIYDYGELSEKLKLTYFDIPIRLCIGQPAADRVTAYFKLGITPSIKVSSKFEGEGTYSLKGYYPQWDVTLENIPELGFGNDINCYKDGVEPDVRKFVLWGNVAAGVYVPFGKSGLVFNGGVKLDYPFMSLIKETDGSSCQMENIAGKTLIPSLNISCVWVPQTSIMRISLPL